MFWIVTAALAQSYSLNLRVPNAVPAGAPANALITTHTSVLGVADGFADTDVSSTWPYVTCKVRNGDVVITFSTGISNFPTSIPASATCTRDGYSLTVNLAPTPWLPWGQDMTNPSQGMHYDLSIPTNRPDMAGGKLHVLDIQPLPVGPAYVAGAWPGRLTPTLEWDHVECGVFFNDAGRALLKVRITVEAEEDEGYCVLTSQSGVPHAIPISFNR
jgi:hypothetical protein